MICSTLNDELSHTFAVSTLHMHQHDLKNGRLEEKAAKTIYDKKIYNSLAHGLTCTLHAYNQGFHYRVFSSFAFFSPFARYDPVFAAIVSAHV